MTAESTVRTEKKTYTRRVNLVAEGKHALSYLQLGDSQLPVHGNKPDLDFAYGFAYTTYPNVFAPATPCPCATVIS